jgi:hypothetical protein
MRKWMVFSLLLAGCTSTYKDLKPGQVLKDQGVAIGRVKVNYNGMNYTKECAICLTSVNGPCQKLTDEGIFFIHLDKGESNVRRLVCQDKSPQHFNMQGADFVIHEGVNYIGDLTFDWRNKGGFKVALMFGALGAIADESSNDGQLKLTVVNSMKSMDSLMSIYRKQMNDPKAQAKSSIAKSIQ